CGYEGDRACLCCHDRQRDCVPWHRFVCKDVGAGCLAAASFQDPVDDSEGNETDQYDPIKGAHRASTERDGEDSEKNDQQNKKSKDDCVPGAPGFEEWRFFFHYCLAEIMFTNKRNAPGTPAGNSRKNEYPV